MNIIIIIKGASAFARALSVNASLQSLDLSHNRFDSLPDHTNNNNNANNTNNNNKKKGGASGLPLDRDDVPWHALSAMLLMNSTLEYLHLSGNAMSPEDAQVLHV